VRICERREVDFIQRYVFPGGMLPSPQVLKSLGDRFGIPVIRERIFGQDYARTLAIWRNNFRARRTPNGVREIDLTACYQWLACAPRSAPLGSPDIRQQPAFL
jgi:cyclopropane-fatty-acyl-phospholipid synthase